MSAAKTIEMRKMAKVTTGFSVAIHFGCDVMNYKVIKMNGYYMYLKNIQDESTLTLKLIGEDWTLPSGNIVEEVYFKHPAWNKYVQMLSSTKKKEERSDDPICPPPYYLELPTYPELFPESVASN